MEIEKDPKFQECLKDAKEAKELRNQARRILRNAQKIEEGAVKGIRALREEEVDKLHKERKKIVQDNKRLNEEYLTLAKTFCQQKGKHSIISRTVKVGNKPL